MGIHVYLAVAGDRVPDAAWREIRKAMKALAPPADEAIQEDLLRRLRSIQRARVSDELEIVAPTCRDPSGLQPGTQQV